MQLSQGMLDGKGMRVDLLGMWRRGWDAGLFRYTLRKRQCIKVVVSLYFGCHKLKKSVCCCKLL